jgi:hypothetical protein
MLERWGRNGVERLCAGSELDRLKVPVISVREGVDEPGLIRYVRAGRDEEFSRKLSLKMVDNLPAAVKDGTYLGRTPIGYRRVFTENTSYRKHPRPARAPSVNTPTTTPSVCPSRMCTVKPSTSSLSPLYFTTLMNAEHGPCPARSARMSW